MRNYQPNPPELHVFLRELLANIVIIAEYMAQQKAARKKEERSPRDMFYDVYELSVFFKVSTRTIQRWIKGGTLPGFKMKGKYCSRLVIDAKHKS